MRQPQHTSLRGAAALGALCLAGCSDALPLYEINGATMGTYYSVKAVGVPANGEALRKRIEATLDAVNASMSTYAPDSELSLFNAQQSTNWFTVSHELCSLVEAAQALSVLTAGAFDVTVGPLVNLWGFGPGEARGEPPSPARLAEVLPNVGFTWLHADCSMPALRKGTPGIYVDLSAIAKGHAVDRVADLLEAAAISGYLVEIGGELRAHGSNAKGKPWAIAIETPQRSGRAVQSIVEVSDAAVATSGDYRNYFEHDGEFFSHTIDPRTGAPVVHGLAAVTVVADTAEFADGLATALLVLGPREGYELAERENVAAFFLTRTDSGVEALKSTQFSARVPAR